MRLLPGIRRPSEPELCAFFPLVLDSPLNHALLCCVQLLRTIVVDQPQRKRRLGGEEQSVKFAVDEEPRLASPPRAKKQAVAARASGPGPSHPRAGTASPTAASAPRQPERQPEHPADSGGSKPEPTEFQPPKSLQELRKVRPRARQWEWVCLWGLLDILLVPAVLATCGSLALSKDCTTCYAGAAAAVDKLAGEASAVIHVSEGEPEGMSGCNSLRVVPVNYSAGCFLPQPTSLPPVCVQAVHSRPSKHKPILWQPEAGQAPAGPQQVSRA